MIMDFIEKIIIKMAIWFIRRGYGADCETKDYEDFPEIKTGEWHSRCASCEAAEIIEWLEKHLDLFKKI